MLGRFVSCLSMTSKLAHLRPTDVIRDCPKTRELSLSLPITWAGSEEKFVEVNILPIQQNRFLVYRR